MNEIQSFQPIINQDSRVLILGSIPSVKSLVKKEYYGNERNHFWRIIFEIFNVKFNKDYHQKKEFILSNKIALWDVLHHCERVGSLDSSIINEQVNNFKDFLEMYPNIRFVGFNGNKAYESFKKHVGFSLLTDRNISYTKLRSTSPVPGKNVKTYEEKLKSWSIILDFR